MIINDQLLRACIHCIKFNMETGWNITTVYYYYYYCYWQYTMLNDQSRTSLRKYSIKYPPVYFYLLTVQKL